MHKPAGDGEAWATLLPPLPATSPGPRAPAAPGSPPLPEAAQLRPRPRVSPLTRTRARSSRSSSPQPQAGGAGSALCGMLRAAVRAGRPPSRPLRHVARAAAAKDRGVGGEWYPEPRCRRELRERAGASGRARLFGAVRVPPLPFPTTRERRGRNRNRQFKRNSVGTE